MMQKTKIKRINRHKKKTTTAEKVLTGVGVGATFLGMGGMGGQKVSSQAPKTSIVSQNNATTAGKLIEKSLASIFNNFKPQVAKADGEGNAAGDNYDPANTDWTDYENLNNLGTNGNSAYQSTGQDQNVIDPSTISPRSTDPLGGIQDVVMDPAAANGAEVGGVDPTQQDTGVASGYGVTAGPADPFVTAEKNLTPPEQTATQAPSSVPDLTLPSITSGPAVTDPLAGIKFDIPPAPPSQSQNNNLPSSSLPEFGLSSNIPITNPDGSLYTGVNQSPGNEVALPPPPSGDITVYSTQPVGTKTNNNPSTQMGDFSWINPALTATGSTPAGAPSSNLGSFNATTTLGNKGSTTEQAYSGAGSAGTKVSPGNDNPQLSTLGDTVVGDLQQQQQNLTSFITSQTNNGLTITQNSDGTYQVTGGVAGVNKTVSATDMQALANQAATAPADPLAGLPNTGINTNLFGTSGINVSSSGGGSGRALGGELGGAPGTGTDSNMFEGVPMGKYDKILMGEIKPAEVVGTTSTAEGQLSANVAVNNPDGSGTIYTVDFATGKITDAINYDANGNSTGNGNTQIDPQTAQLISGSMVASSANKTSPSADLILSVNNPSPYGFNSTDNFQYAGVTPTLINGEKLNAAGNLWQDKYQNFYSLDAQGKPVPVASQTQQGGLIVNIGVKSYEVTSEGVVTPHADLRATFAAPPVSAQEAQAVSDFIAQNPGVTPNASSLVSAISQQQNNTSSTQTGRALQSAPTVNLTVPGIQVSALVTASNPAAPIAPQDLPATTQNGIPLTWDGNVATGADNRNYVYNTATQAVEPQLQMTVSNISNSTIVSKIGDTLASLSASSGYSVDQLAALNPAIAGPNETIQTGTDIKLPNGNVVYSFSHNGVSYVTDLATNDLYQVGPSTQPLIPLGKTPAEIAALLPNAAISYVSKSGDTLASLAAASGYDIDQFTSINPSVSNPNQPLASGTLVNFPGGLDLVTTNSVPGLKTAIYGNDVFTMDSQKNLINIGTVVTKDDVPPGAWSQISSGLQTSNQAVVGGSIYTRDVNGNVIKTGTIINLSTKTVVTSNGGAWFSDNPDDLFGSTGDNTFPNDARLPSQDSLFEKLFGNNKNVTIVNPTTLPNGITPSQVAAALQNSNSAIVNGFLFQKDAQNNYIYVGPVINTADTRTTTGTLVDQGKLGEIAVALTSPGKQVGAASPTDSQFTLNTAPNQVPPSVTVGNVTVSNLGPGIEAKQVSVNGVQGFLIPVGDGTYQVVDSNGKDIPMSVSSWNQVFQAAGISKGTQTPAVLNNTPSLAQTYLGPSTSYITKDGDTITQISQNTGIPITNLLAANHDLFGSSDLPAGQLPAGQTMVIPNSQASVDEFGNANGSGVPNVGAIAQNQLAVQTGTNTLSPDQSDFVTNPNEAFNLGTGVSKNQPAVQTSGQTVSAPTVNTPASPVNQTTPQSTVSGLPYAWDVQDSTWANFLNKGYVTEAITLPNGTTITTTDGTHYVDGNGNNFVYKSGSSKEDGSLQYADPSKGLVTVAGSKFDPGSILAAPSYSPVIGTSLFQDSSGNYYYQQNGNYVALVAPSSTTGQATPSASQTAGQQTAPAGLASTQQTMPETKVAPDGSTVYLQTTGPDQSNYTSNPDGTGTQYNLQSTGQWLKQGDSGWTDITSPDSGTAKSVIASVSPSQSASQVLTTGTVNTTSNTVTVQNNSVLTAIPGTNAYQDANGNVFIHDSANYPDNYYVQANITADQLAKSAVNEKGQVYIQVSPGQWVNSGFVFDSNTGQYSESTDSSSILSTVLNVGKKAAAGAGSLTGAVKGQGSSNNTTPASTNNTADPGAADVVVVDANNNATQLWKFNNGQVSGNVYLDEKGNVWTLTDAKKGIFETAGVNLSQLYPESRTDLSVQPQDITINGSKAIPLGDNTYLGSNNHVYVLGSDDKAQDTGLYYNNATGVIAAQGNDLPIDTTSLQSKILDSKAGGVAKTGAKIAGFVFRGIGGIASNLLIDKLGKSNQQQIQTWLSTPGDANLNLTYIDQNGQTQTVSIPKDQASAWLNGGTVGQAISNTNQVNQYFQAVNNGITPFGLPALFATLPVGPSIPNNPQANTPSGAKGIFKSFPFGGK